MKFLIILLLVFLRTTTFAIDKATLIGAWHDLDTKTVFVFFPDGSVLFTFLKPPADEPIQDWHNKAAWEITSRGEVKITFNRMSNIQKPKLFQVNEGDLVSPDGPVYIRLATK